MSNLLKGLTLGLVLSIMPAAAHAQTAEQTYFEFEVERPAKQKNKISPTYPEKLLRSRTEGEVLVQFVVDEKGTPDVESIKVIRSTNNEFTDSVKNALRRVTFFPAEIRGRKVRQVVQQPYTFVVN